VNMKPFPKMVFAFILMMLTVIGLKAGIDHGFIPTPGIMSAVTKPSVNRVVTWTPNDVTVQRDADWYLAQHIVQANGYSNGDDALIAPSTTGSSSVDSALRFVWNNVGKLLLVFILLTAAALFSTRLDSSNTHNDQMRREALDRLEAESNGEIHEPFDAPEGMQPATQYEPIRTRH